MASRRAWTGAVLLAAIGLGGCGLPASPVELLNPPVSRDNLAMAEKFRALLPDGARLLSAPSYGDIDGDGVSDAILVYAEPTAAKRTLKAALAMQVSGDWKIVWDTIGFGYGLDYAGIHDVNGDGRQELLLGWSLGAGGNGLDIYQWQNQNILLLDTRNYEGHLGSDTRL